MPIEVDGIDHIYVSVSDLERSESFYDGVMRLLDFRKSSGPLAGGERHVHYYNKVTQFTIRPAGAAGPHDPLAPGLHHVCFRVAAPGEVDAAAAALRALGIETTDPQHYPEYDSDYYATFFSDPDGIRLEIVNHHEERRRIVEDWDRIP